MTSLTKHHGSYFKGVALVTVMAFILILSMVMLPLVLGVFQQTSSATITKRNITLTETLNSAAELVRYKLSTASTGLSEVGIAQGRLKLKSLNCTATIANFGNQPTYRYYDFEVLFTPASNNESGVTFTGSAVEQIVGGAIPSKVHITHVVTRK